jgi:hypothetical protein
MNVDFKIMNLSSGNIIYFSNANISKYSYNRTMNWETTPVVGRMDPIYNFRNTEGKVEIVLQASGIRIFPFDEIPTKESLKNRIDDESLEGKLYNIDYYSQRYLSSFFYPSYQQDGKSFFMKTAPVFQCKLINRADKKTFFAGYATIPSFNYEKSKFVGTGGVPLILEVSFTLNVIHDKLIQVGSKYLSTDGAPIVDPDTILGG